MSLFLFCLLAHATGVKAPAPRQLTASDLQDLHWRSIGPANMGGRISVVTFAPGSSKEYFVGTGTGGAFVTTDEGTSFKPIFEHEGTSSIGSLAVTNDLKTHKPTDIWIGTGEGNGRNSSSWGDGVYHSTDGGSTWSHVGLEDSKDIPALAVDPADPNTCYAAALGHLWGPNPMRGIYKTTDGGKTWKQSLFINDTIGADDVVMNPQSPNTVYAAFYKRLRTPWGFQAGSTKAGIFRTTDGGQHWTKLTDGLPTETGRIGLAISPSNPKIVMAIVESDEGGVNGGLEDNVSRAGGVFRSEDGGDHWTRLSHLDPRPFYFSKLTIDPKDPNTVYMMGWEVWKSTDGGKTFQQGVSDELHTDWHTLAVDPNDSDHLVGGEDGGLYQTVNSGKTWQFLNKIALGEFYTVAVENNVYPYRVSGGLQDNDSWLGVNATVFGGEAAITNANWVGLGGGDGFYTGFDRTDPNIVYFESQGGSIERRNVVTGHGKGIAPSPAEGEQAFRFNWNAPFVVSRFEPETIYLGGNKVFKLTHRGDESQEISPDLTTNDGAKYNASGSGAETYCTIVSLAESPLKQGMLWTGSDDGLIQVTQDDGKTWTNVTPSMVKGEYISGLAPSHFKAGICYASVDGHRSDDYNPHLLMTDNFGKSWKDITGDLPKGTSIRCVTEDETNPDMLYVGTEQGAFVSADGGTHWISLNPEGLPTVGVHDLKQQSMHMDLVAATHGRSIWILDDAASLSALTEKVMNTPLYAFTPHPARAHGHWYNEGFQANNAFKAPNPYRGCIIDYWVKDGGQPGASIEIKDASGKVVAHLNGGSHPGINRVHWDLQPEGKLTLPNQGQSGEPVLVDPGTYTVTITVGKETATTPLTVLAPDY